MAFTKSVAFDSPDLGSELSRLDTPDMDELIFGVVEMNIDGIVQRYNATESGFSGLSREQVIGRHFFREVATCCDNRHVAKRFALPVLDETIAYTLALQMKPVPVILRMIKHPDNPLMYMLVRLA